MKYSMFCTYEFEDSDIQKSGPVLISASSVMDAKKRVEEHARQLRNAGADVSILLMGDDPDGRPVHKIGY